jgi:hypothetical protein
MTKNLKFANITPRIDGACLESCPVAGELIEMISDLVQNFNRWGVVDFDDWEGSWQRVAACFAGGLISKEMIGLAFNLAFLSHGLKDFKRSHLVRYLTCNLCASYRETGYTGRKLVTDTIYSVRLDLLLLAEFVRRTSAG